MLCFKRPPLAMSHEMIIWDDQIKCDDKIKINSVKFDWSSSVTAYYLANSDESLTIKTIDNFLNSKSWYRQVIFNNPVVKKQSNVELFCLQSKFSMPMYFRYFLIHYVHWYDTN